VGGTGGAGGKAGPGGPGGGARPIAMEAPPAQAAPTELQVQSAMGARLAGKGSAF
jgi:hypothetical protein